MATPFTHTPRIGADLKNITKLVDLAGSKKGDTQLGTQVFASDGKRYVYAEAGGAIPASTAVCTVSPTTFAATATGGAYLSPATAMATGDRAWFGAASV